MCGLISTSRYLDRQKISDIWGILMTEKNLESILNAAETPTF